MYIFELLELEMQNKINAYEFDNGGLLSLVRERQSELFKLRTMLRNFVKIKEIDSLSLVAIRMVYEEVNLFIRAEMYDKVSAKMGFRPKSIRQRLLLVLNDPKFSEFNFFNTLLEEVSQNLGNLRDRKGSGGWYDKVIELEEKVEKLSHLVATLGASENMLREELGGIVLQNEILITERKELLEQVHDFESERIHNQRLIGEFEVQHARDQGRIQALEARVAQLSSDLDNGLGTQQMLKL